MTVFTELGKLEVWFGGHSVSLHMLGSDDKNPLVKNRLAQLPRAGTRADGTNPNVVFLRTLAASEDLLKSLKSLRDAAANIDQPIPFEIIEQASGLLDKIEGKS